MEVVHIPSHGALMNGVLYEAAGAGPHPTLLLLHGFPGNEQNLDLAQAVRRDGWTVLTFHYRGSWGSGGTYSFAHVFEDAQSALDFLRDPANATRYGIDTQTIAVAGHSLGGMAAAIVGRDNPGLVGVAMISAADFGRIGDPRASGGERKLATFMADNMESLAGTSPAALAHEATIEAPHWDFVNFASALAHHPLLLITSNDGLADASDALGEAVRKQGGNVTDVHLATDHSYSDQRIALEAAVLNWLKK